MYRFPSWSFESPKLPMHLHVRHLSSHKHSLLQIWGAFSEILLKKNVFTSGHVGNCITWVLTDKHLQNRDHSKRLMTCHTISPSQNSYSCHIIITLGWVLPFFSLFKLGIQNGRCISESTMGFFFSWRDRPPGKTRSWPVAYMVSRAA